MTTDYEREPNRCQRCDRVCGGLLVCGPCLERRRRKATVATCAHCGRSYDGPGFAALPKIPDRGHGTVGDSGIPGIGLDHRDCTCRPGATFCAYVDVATGRHMTDAEVEPTVEAMAERIFATRGSR